ncbi:UNVERIFIED_CONTAM: Pistil-specific extensin-like protein [Sesamum radiatum]|uniref:Pistil-specific extensin-like protein n=1 Tax=Sesamum radiatum TaxID=300843 RepID=A0AAW2NML4_SESRA
MGADTLLKIAASVLVFSSICVAAGDSKDAVFKVGGRVLCQDCSEGWNEWVNGANPIKGCKVSVTCLDDRNRVVHYASDLTDDVGDFEITCNKYVNSKELKPQNCFVRLVSSPDPVCNIATNFGGGKSGVKLLRPAIVYRDIVKYMLGPFYYTTPMCDEPDTSAPNEDDSDDVKQSNY